MKPRRFAPGFRFSVLDGLVVASCIAVVCAMGLASVISWIVALVVGHFFLFCNVFRISRPPELIWGGLFLALTASNLCAGMPAFGWVAATSVATSALLIARELQRPDYHGVAWRRINPGLPKWWQKNVGEAPIL